MKKIFQRKKNILILILCLLGIAVYWSVKKTHSVQAISSGVIWVEAAQVKLGNIPIEAQAIGTLTSAKNVDLSFEIAGQVSKIFIKDGVFVKAGTPLIQLDDSVYQARYQSSQAAFVFSEANYKRMQWLGHRGAITQQAIDQAMADLKEKQATVSEDGMMLKKMQLVAPFDGVTGECDVTLGQYVNIGQKIITLTDMQNLRVEYSVSEKYLSSLKLGQLIQMTTPAYPGKIFTGKISFISPTINRDNRTLTLYADIPNENHLLASGLFVNVIQSLGTENNILLVPASSLVPTIDGQKIYKINDNRVEAIPVTIKERNGEIVAVIGKLSPNDWIVTDGQNKLRDGAIVHIKNMK